MARPASRARRDGARRDGARRDGARRDGARRDGARRDGSAGTDRQVFQDTSGFRWLRVKRLVAATLLLAAGMAGWLLPKALAEDSSDAPSAHSIAAKLPDQLPVLGAGDLLRVVEVRWIRSYPYAADPFSATIYRPLRQAEMQQIGWDTYAIERFARLPAHQLALTFDDGPDPRNTPALLDLLSREQVPATFFTIGANIVDNPELFRRMVREGHLVGNHTYTHPRLSARGSTRDHLELVTTARVMRSVGGRDSGFFRLPYGGDDTDSISRSAAPILDAQQLGMVTAGFDIDTDDWQYQPGQRVPEPRLDGRGHVLLLHDGGADRTATLGLVRRLVADARAQGYTFVTMAPLHPGGPTAARASPPSLADTLTYRTLWAVHTLPGAVLRFLFVLGAGTMIGVSAGNVALALWVRHRAGHRPAPLPRPPVTVLIAAYNEAAVIEKTLTSLRGSRYPELAVLVVDDGSTDGTRDILRRVAAGWPALTVLAADHGGKAAALNRGLAEIRTEVVVTFDADTVVLPDTIVSLARHFGDDRVGAVAGLVKVGNRRGLLAWWQSLEYLSGITIDRMAQGLLGAIMIVPGACAAWRRSAVLAAGGYSHRTLAEDCDLTLSLQQRGYRIVSDTDAVAYTEAPQTPRALLTQRFRWMFGNLQAIWRHRRILFRPRHRALGLLVMPYAVLSILVPLVFLPFTYAIVIQGVVTGTVRPIVFYLAVLTAYQLVIAVIAVWLTREKWRHLLVVPLYRLIYEPLRAYLLYAALLAVLRGRAMGWHKLGRTGSVTLGPAVDPRRPVPVES
jgi:cellulose synthase/poly-beta-1,6-N-acetylglucosamine synthase-like glycosyltransferase/peptidoglycan/xylan/chitin deacetylase (PgdA/CDA1 family)